MPTASTIPRIHTVRNQRVMLDSELAQLYQVATKAFNQAIVRNTRPLPYLILPFNLPARRLQT